MTDQSFERRVATAIAAYADHAPTDVEPVKIARLVIAGSRRIGPVWIGNAPIVGWPALGLVVLALILAGIVGGALFVGGQPRPMPAVVGPAGNGLVAYDAGGDIYVGDATTGTTTAIVRGPHVDSRPMFSPDGTRIAFHRGDRWTEHASIVVVRADGSDERVVMPTGFNKRGAVTFAWTPDSAAVVVNHDSAPFTTPYFDGELTMFDAAALNEPRLLTPPLTKWPGTDSLHNSQVAPMFRPPNADLILSGPSEMPGWSREIYLWDADIEHHTVLTPEVPGGKAFEPYYVGPRGWSPDGSQIVFGVGSSDPADPDRETPIDGTYLMDADGSEVRRIGWGGSWSPDGTKLAYEVSPVCTSSVIAVSEMASGAERELEATRVSAKFEGRPPSGAIDPNCPGYELPDGRGWTYEGWSWTPDGRSIVMLERSGDRPKVVDVETGAARELPWPSDSYPSWQRVGTVDPT